ncbi:hypothetical protein [Parabacteroides sp.]
MLRVLFTCILFVLLLPVVGCQDDLSGELEGTEEKGTVTLVFSAAPEPIIQTKSEVRPAAKGGEADRAGFSYEMVVTSIDSVGPATKAMTTSFKNAVALLFASDGKYNGKASIGEFNRGDRIEATFTGVTNTTETNCRLVLIADDAASTVDLVKATTSLGSFTGTYTEFYGTNGPAISSDGVKQDADIPYVGSITGIGLSGDKATIYAVPLYRMLAKIMTPVPVLTNASGASSYNIMMYQIRGTNCRFGTNNEYNGNGTNPSVHTGDQASGFQVNNGMCYRYLGENIRSNLSSTSYKEQDRSKLSGASFFNITLTYPEKTISDLQVGDEYVGNSKISFAIFLGSNGPSDFSVRRNHVYNITVNLDGTRDDFIAQSNIDKRIVVDGHYGLCIGYFGGPSFTNATDFNAVSGSYTKKLLLEPNTSRSYDVNDNQWFKWSSNTSAVTQSELRRAWDYSYIKGLNNGLGGMDNAEGYAYKYCYDLTLGGVSKGTWYVPTLMQLMAIWTVVDGLREKPVYQYYSRFDGNYWASTEWYGADGAWRVAFDSGYAGNQGKGNNFPLRCVRDL